MNARRRRRQGPHVTATLAAATLLTSALLSGCSGAPGAAAAPGDGPAATGTESPAATAQGATDGAGTWDNCGVEVRLEAAPRRVVTIKSSALELVLALGLQDRVVGAAFLDGPVPVDLEPAAADVPRLSDGVPGQEAVLALEPDLVMAGWESNFSVDGAGERADLQGLGVATYVAPSACRSPEHRPDPLTFEGVFGDITEAGDLLGVPDAAAALVADQREQLAAVDPDGRGLTALWYSSGTDVPYVGAGTGAPQMIMDAVGLTNVAGDVQDSWTSFGWEDVVDADPDVIVLVDATWNSAEQKIAFLEANPATARLAAVRDESYLVVPFPATEAGVRNVAAASGLSQQLTTLGAVG